MRSATAEAAACSRSHHGLRITKCWHFGKVLLVFSCIGTDLCKWIRVFQQLNDFWKSTRIASWKFESWQNFADFWNFCKCVAVISRKIQLLIFKKIFCWSAEFGAVQKCANLVELENAVKRIVSCKFWFRYSRERARQKFATNLREQKMHVIC